MNVDPIVLELAADAVRVRRDLHRIPEIGFCERKTQAYIRDFLHEQQPDVIERIADTGIKAVFFAYGATETIALRADIDALAIQEHNTDLEYCSTHADTMHACGHDGHMTMLLLVAKLINKYRDSLKCNVVMLFQPAEESIGGAMRMIREGALTNPVVDKIFGMHVWPDVPAGKIAIREGLMMAQTNQFDITLIGKSAHGAAPQEGIDTIVAAAHFITMVQTIISRSIDPQRKALITIGRIGGGQTRNIIAEKVALSGTIRSFENETSTRVVTRIMELLEGVAKATGIKYEYKDGIHYPVVENPVELCDYIKGLLEKEDIESVDEVMAAEDFSFYQRQVPGAFMFLGIGDESCKFPLHSSSFNFNEHSLLYGVEIYRKIIGIENTTY